MEMKLKLFGLQERTSPAKREVSFLPTRRVEHGGKEPPPQRVHTGICTSSSRLVHEHVDCFSREQETLEGGEDDE
jgi:hypothetical protein